ncbi:MAG: MBL fold metallo-hydrolase [Rikenellaceae bacterium]
MEVKVIAFNPVQENTYIIWDETKECAIIDAGNFNTQESEYLFKTIDELGLKPVLAINTHGHFDHLMGVEAVRERYNTPFALSSKDQYLLDTFPEGTVVYGMRIGKMPSSYEIDLDSVDSVKVGNMTIQIIKTPGHTPGHVSLYEAESRTLFTGDTLFRESIGRTDLPGGDYSVLMNTLTKCILPMGDDIKVYPGHAEPTSIGHEALYNPFIVEAINGEVGY